MTRLSMKNSENFEVSDRAFLWPPKSVEEWPTHINHLPSLKLTWHLKMGYPKRKFIFQPSIFGGYISFSREGKLQVDGPLRSQVTLTRNDFSGCIALPLYTVESEDFVVLSATNQFKQIHKYMNSIEFTTCLTSQDYSKTVQKIYPTLRNWSHGTCGVS